MRNEVSDLEAELLIREGERMEDLQLDGLRILQKRQGFRYGMDAVLLADFARIGKGDHVADFGTGTGILPLLLYGRQKGARFDAFEIQEDMAEMARRSMVLNGLSDVIRVHALPVERAREVLPPRSMDAIISNPPYGAPGTTLLNPDERLRLARHQTQDGLTEWFCMAYELLKGKGRIAIVYPAPRMLEAMDAMRAARLVPKRFRLVYPYADRPANLVLLEAMRDAKPMLHPEPSLIIRHPDGTETEELKAIYCVSTALRSKS